MGIELNKIKSGIAYPFDERDETPHFHLIISKNKTSIGMLKKYVEYLENCLDITEFEKINWCGCGDELTCEEDIKTGLCWLCRAFENDRRIEEDLHTNTHYDLIKGKMWIKGNATGKFWSLLCNSRDAQKDARNILNLY